MGSSVVAETFFSPVPNFRELCTIKAGITYPCWCIELVFLTADWTEIRILLLTYHVIKGFHS